MLRKLYRRVDEKGVWSAVHRVVPKGAPSVWRQLLEVVEGEGRMEEACEIKRA